MIAREKQGTKDTRVVVAPSLRKCTSRWQLGQFGAQTGRPQVPPHARRLTPKFLTIPIYARLSKPKSVHTLLGVVLEITRGHRHETRISSQHYNVVYSMDFTTRNTRNSRVTSHSDPCAFMRYQFLVSDPCVFMRYVVMSCQIKIRARGVTKLKGRARRGNCDCICTR